MLQALLAGKLSSSQENMEDVLTSSVFGSFQYLPHNEALAPFLRTARGIDPGDKPFNELSIRSAGYTFWPDWSEPGYTNCEPDLVLSVTDERGSKLLISVEVKYRSGKSGYEIEDIDAPTDQLAKEWDHVVLRARQVGARPFLVYVTTDTVIPKVDIEQAKTEYERKCGKLGRFESFRCSWISWRSLYRALLGSQEELAVDLRRLAEKLRFAEFDGFSEIGPASVQTWTYIRSYNWGAILITPSDWKYVR